MKEWIFDIEGDNLLEGIEKIYCLSYCSTDDHIIHTIYTKEDILAFFKRDGVFIGHVIGIFDLPALTKLYGLEVDFLFYDTIYLSTYIFPRRLKYGLESFGEDYGVHKVKVNKNEWKTLSIEKAKERCEGDVKIQANLWHNIKYRLNKLYDNKDDLAKFYKYEAFKAKCAYDQTQEKLRIDKDKAYDLLILLHGKQEEKLSQLRAAMPRTPIYKEHNKPKILLKKDGSESELAKKWYSFLRDNNLPLDTDVMVREVIGYSDANPNSDQQKKDWLFSLGWEPQTLKTIKDKDTGAERTIPQIQKEVDGEKVLCDSVALLAGTAPEVELLAGLGILQHRIGVVNGLLAAADEDGYLIQFLQSQTSTMRYKHRNVVNLVSVDRPFGRELRGLFIPPPGCKIGGVDVSKLENKVKESYIYDYDPDYVKTLQDPNYDPYLEIAVMAGFLTEEQARQHKAKEADYSTQRKYGKVTVLSSQYGVGPATLSRNLGLEYSLAAKLIETYKIRNKAQYDFAADLTVKTEFGQKWVFNPVSRFWMELRSEKDRLSAIFSSTGVYFFDTFKSYCKILGIKPALESHDELLFYVLDSEDAEKEAAKKLNKAIKYTNERIKLNVKIGVEYKFGHTYADTH